MPEPTQKHELSNLRACRKTDINLDGLQFVCISLGWSLLKSMTHPILEHAEQLILAYTVFNFYALAWAGPTERYELSHVAPCTKVYKIHGFL